MKHEQYLTRQHMFKLDVLVIIGNVSMIITR
jgi:hypothetical protein